MKDFFKSPVKVIGAITYCVLMYGIYEATKMGHDGVVNLFLFFNALLISVGYDALSEDEV